MAGTAARPFLLDASAILRWGPNVPTGIPRVEASLVSEAIAARGEKAEFFAFDPGIARCRTLTADEREFIETCVAGGVGSSASPDIRDGLLTRCRKVIALYRGNLFCAGRESHRSIAQYLLGAEGREGIGYVAVKTGVRAAFSFGRAWTRWTRPDRRVALPDPLADPSNTCLLSINTCSTLYRHYREAEIRSRVLLLVYDTTPLDYPDLAVEGHKERFADYFRFGLTIASEMLCISGATRDSVLKWGGTLGIPIDPRRLHVMPLASSLSEARVPAIPVPGLAGTRYVVYCATLEPRKNHIVLLRAWSRLVARHGRATMPLLILVGRWGWRIEATRRLLAEDPNLAGSVRIYSFLPDSQLKWLYGTALFTVFPSVAEGWGLGATESLDLGTPVLVSDIGALSEATQGLMLALPAHEETRWQDELDRWISNDDLRAGLHAKIAASYRKRSFREVYADMVDVAGADVHR